ncbi:MAG: hypothetical protein LBV02_08425 [Bacteroidales bacterium]|jgi:hypothetical protein|nr:hypothetical protein [Bacteroidales bacterium]
MNFEKLTPLILLITCSSSLLAQQDTIFHFEEFHLEEYIENIEDEEVDLNEELTELFSDRTVKYNINTLSAEIAYKLFQMTDYQYYQLLAYIGRYGELVTLHELAAIDGFAAEYVEAISPYLVVENTKVKKHDFFKNLKYGKGEVLLRYGSLMETAAGYDTTRNNHYLGSKARISFKIKYTDNRHVSIGFSGEKDPGEGIFGQYYRQGFDHYSGHIRIKDVGILKSLIAGDFRINWGQGLILGSGLMGGSGSGVATIRKLPGDLQAVASINESNYFTGIATSLGNHRWQTTIFYGQQRFDADIHDPIAGDDIQYDGTLSTSGYHRTEKELTKKRKIKNRNVGVEFRYNRRLFRMGVRSLAQFLNVNLVPSGTLYRMYDLEGNLLFNNSMDYHLILGKTILFGEIASSDLSGYGILQGILFFPDPRIKSGILFRKYSKNFHAISGNAFGVNSRNRHETGIYFTNEIVVGKKTALLLAIDIYQIEWLRYRIDKPGYGENFTLRISHQMNRNATFAFAYLYRTNFKNSSDETAYNEIVQYGKHQMKASLAYSSSSRLKFKTHSELLVNHYITKNMQNIGYLVYQDINYSVSRIPLEICYRTAFFDTDGYEARIYAYEHDLNQVFNVSGYYYRGWRTYITLKYQYRFVKIQLRYSHTKYLNKKELGSGLERIDGNQKNEIKAQLLFNF